MDRLRAAVAAGLIAASVLACGCYKTATNEPFAREEPDVRLEGLAAVGAGALGQFGLGFNETMAKLSGGTPASLKHARTLANPEAEPDDLHVAIIGLVKYDYGRKAPYTDAYVQVARSSPHALVRATAIRALNISRHAPSTPLFIQALADAAPVVRLEGAKALANVPDDAALAPLSAIAGRNNEELDVRMAAIDALRHYEAAEGRRLLVTLLESDDFSLAWQARRSLVTSTGEDHGFDLAAWRRAAG